MFDQILDNYRRAAETTMQFQQTMLRSWFQQQMPPMFGMPGNGIPGFNLPNGGAVLEQMHAAQKKWSDTVTGMLTKHRELLDAQYKAGIATIEDAFKVGEAQRPRTLPTAHRGTVEAQLRGPEDRHRRPDEGNSRRGAEVVRAVKHGGRREGLKRVVVDVDHEARNPEGATRWPAGTR